MKESIDFQNGTIFVLPRLRLDDIEVHSSSIVAGAPNPTALIGFAHALERRVGIPGLFSGISMIAHDFEMTIGASRNPGDSGGPSAMMDLPKARMSVTLLLRSSKVVDEDDMISLLERIQSCIGGMRLSGGVIWSTENFRFFYENDAFFAYMKRVCKKTPGSVLRDRTEVFLPENGQGHDALDALMNTLAFHRIEGASAKRETKGWLVPLLIGYRGISPEAAIPGIRDGVERHRWVEEVIGLGEWVPFKRAAREGFVNCFWDIHARSEQGFFLARGF